MMTGPELALVVNAHRRRARDAQQLAISQAWYTARLVRAKRVPALKRLLRGVTRKGRAALQAEREEQQAMMQRAHDAAPPNYRLATMADVEALRAAAAEKSKRGRFGRRRKGN